MEIYTIGFTKRSASDFFETLRDAGVRRLIDTRLNNTSQLAAFAKRDDLAYFLHELIDADYRHEPLLTPTEEILEAYKKGRIDWPAYEQKYMALLRDRRIEERLVPKLFEDPAVLLCSERTPERCHRRLAVEYLALHWSDVQAVHL